MLEIYISLDLIFNFMLCVKDQVVSRWQMLRSRFLVRNIQQFPLLKMLKRIVELCSLVFRPSSLSPPPARLLTDMKTRS